MEAFGADVVVVTVDMMLDHIVATVSATAVAVIIEARLYLAPLAEPHRAVLSSGIVQWFGTYSCRGGLCILLAATSKHHVEQREQK